MDYPQHTTVVYNSLQMVYDSYSKKAKNVV